MTLGLAAPAAVPVEVRAADRRVYRLSAQIGEGGIDLERPVPFEVGRPVRVRFRVPGAAAPCELDAEVAARGTASEGGGDLGGAALRFLDPPFDAQVAIMEYVVGRLGLPPLDLARRDARPEEP
jgi:hypothetical protein